MSGRKQQSAPDVECAAPAHHEPGVTSAPNRHAAAGDVQLSRIDEPAPGWDGVDPVAPGSEIWVKRPLGYHHAGVYVGKGWVVHLDGSPAMHGVRIALLGESWATVIKTSVASFAEGGKVGVGLTPATRPPGAVVTDALHMVGRTIRYDPVSQNCQHLSSLLVSGTSQSPEVELMIELGIQAAGHQH